MKHYIILIGAVAMSLKCYAQQINSSFYIEIKHTGVEEKHIRGLILSVKNLNYDVSCKCFTPTPEQKKYLSKHNMDFFAGFDYNLITVNEKEMKKIIYFIDSHLAFYTNSIQKNHGDYSDYAIIVKNSPVSKKTYNIYYKLKNAFFSDLISYLRKSACDKRIISILKDY